MEAEADLMVSIKESKFGVIYFKLMVPWKCALLLLMLVKDKTKIEFTFVE